jgi:hypothetical protein
MSKSQVPDPALPDDKPPEVQPLKADPNAPGAGERNINSPDLGGSFEENGQVRLHDGIGAGAGMEVLDEALAAAKQTERHSSAGS